MEAQFDDAFLPAPLLHQMGKIRRSSNTDSPLVKLELLNIAFSTTSDHPTTNIGVHNVYVFAHSLCCVDDMHLCAVL